MLIGFILFSYILFKKRAKAKAIDNFDVALVFAYLAVMYAIKVM